MTDEKNTPLTAHISRQFLIIRPIFNEAFSSSLENTTVNELATLALTKCARELKVTLPNPLNTELELLASQISTRITKRTKEFEALTLLMNEAPNFLMRWYLWPFKAIFELKIGNRDSKIILKTYKTLIAYQSPNSKLIEQEKTDLEPRQLPQSELDPQHQPIDKKLYQ